jgi:hypothetical protein
MTKKKQEEPLYTAKELANNADKIFGANVKSECVRAALEMNKVEESTISTCKRLVKALLEKEVI